MNNAKTLEKLHALAHMLPENEKKTFEFCRKHPDDIHGIIKISPCLGACLADFIAEIENEIRNENAKKCGTLDRLKAAQKIIKSAKTQRRETFWGAWIASDGLQYICDTYRAARFITPLDLETAPKNTAQCDITWIFADAKKSDGAQLDLPDRATLKAYIKTEKAARKAAKDNSGILWDFGENLPALDASFLLDMLEIFPDATATASSMRPECGNVYFTSEAGEGIICPINKNFRR